MIEFAKAGKVTIETRTYALDDGVRAFDDLEAGTVRDAPFSFPRPLASSSRRPMADQTSTPKEKSMEPIYTAIATATGDGRNGHTATEDGMLALDVRIPKEMGGPGGATNPEQLFAAGYAACFHSALKLVGRPGRRPDRHRGVGQRRDRLLADGGSASPWSSTSTPPTSTTTPRGLVHKAHDVCPYSNATRGNVEVALKIV